MYLPQRDPLIGSTALTFPRRRVRANVGDSLLTYDAQFVRDAGAFLNGELERLDPKLHLPLQEVSWDRDIDLRQDVAVGDEISSFTNSAFAYVGGNGGASLTGGKPWISKNGNAITSIQLDIGKTANPLNLYGFELFWTLPELESAMLLNRPVDQDKFNAMRRANDTTIDAQVYIGDTDLGLTGLLNNSSVTTQTVAAGAGGGTAFASKSPQEILADISTLLYRVYAASAFKVVPSTVLIPPAQYSLLVTEIVSTAGSNSILRYVLENNLLTSSTGAPLRILPCKWLLGAGTGGTIGATGTVDRMIAYSKNVDYVRFPMTMLQRTQVQNEGIYQKVYYYGRLGVVEFVYPETVGYADGI